MSCKSLAKKALGALWSGASILRDVGLPSSEYKYYILKLFFYRYISEVWNIQTQRYEDLYPDDEARVKRELSRERFVIPEGAAFDAVLEKIETGAGAEVLTDALNAIEDANSSKLGGVLSSTLIKIRNAKYLRYFLSIFENEVFQELAKEGGSAAGEVYKAYLVEDAERSGWREGIHCTPPELNRLLTQMLAPESGDKVCDPACGVANLLSEMAGNANVELYGQEMNCDIWALAKMHLFLQGTSKVRVVRGDSLRCPGLLEDDKLMQFDIVASAPPMGASNWGRDTAKDDTYQRYWRGIPPKNGSDYAFICHMLETARRDSGKVGVVVPLGVLFRSGAEKVIRQSFIKENILEAVIQLPEKLLYGTSIPVAILIFDKGREAAGQKKSKRNSSVLFVDGSELAEKAHRMNRLSKSGTERILSSFVEFAEEEGFSRCVPLKEIEDNGCNLSVSLYVEKPVEGKEIDIPSLKVALQENQGKLDDVREKLDALIGDYLD